MAFTIKMECDNHDWIYFDITDHNAFNPEHRKMMEQHLNRKLAGLLDLNVNTKNKELIKIVWWI
jgi:hypothetical protein